MQQSKSVLPPALLHSLSKLEGEALKERVLSLITKYEANKQYINGAEWEQNQKDHFDKCIAELNRMLANEL